MKFFSLLACLTLLFSCTSVSKYNHKLETPLNPKQLKSDVDFAYKNLKKLHPELYWYIGKDSLDLKFETLKDSIKNPMTPSQFYEKLAPVIASIREGHLNLIAPQKRLTKKMIRDLKNQKGLLGRMNYVVNDNRIFVKDNADLFENIAIGTEITAINDVPAAKYLQRYKKFITSDGNNLTFQKYSIARRWPVYFTIENGILDSIKLETRYQNQISNVWLHRERVEKEQKKEEQKAIAAIRKDQTKKIKDYNPTIKSYNRDLQFLESDSSVAYMKIKTFSGTYSKKFYKNSFKLLRHAKTDYLILDIRDNLGGSLAEINNLYSYLALQNFRFLDDIEVSSRWSMYHANFFMDVPTLLLPFAAIAYPVYLVGLGFSVKKEDGNFYLKNNNIFTFKKPKKQNFKGKIYVLINGSSFSASAIISSKLKNDQRAILVGEETGGANDGTVAGRYSTKKLPNSGLYLPIGLMLIKPNITFTNTKKGVLPDQEIIPNLKERLQKNDIELQWIQQDIHSLKAPSAKEKIETFPN